MHITLDCSTHESAKFSASQIFNTDETTLIKALKTINPYQDTSQSPSAHIYQQIHLKLGAPIDEFNTVWFHGTRVDNPASFYQDGILPKSAVKPKLEATLISLADDLTHSGSNPFSLSLAGKQTEADEGPFAVLFKDIAIHAPGANHSYIEAPEMVEDIAGSLLGENYHLLVERYQKITQPYIVSFVEQSAGYELPCVLWYLHLIEDGETLIDSASIANTCFNAGGKLIEPKQIHKIERVGNV
ncbi:hypothetical protein [Atopomonas sediminilitoris]|uniref:hypothetical protein n=1 Tax=Atopomonas sediminilitoris TaxID=2919919 RepID=UPI001F4D5FE6|nr:hypothetical protein [Atopomonas sediminilitoris]MCJ8170913.1 hypothetical protein [Atopomonas sediminilitoris]